MQLGRKLLIPAAGILLLSAAWFAAASFSASRYTSMAREGNAYEARSYARNAALLLPTTKNKVEYAYALCLSKDRDERREAKRVLDRLNWDSANVSSTAYYVKAKLEAEDERDLEKAARTSHRGLQRYPDHADLWITLCSLRHEQARFLEALEAADNALKYMSVSNYGENELRQVHTHRVSAAWWLGDWARAVNAAKDAMDSFPEETGWIRYYAIIAENAGQYAAAAEARRRFLKFAPSKSPWDVYDLCRVLGKSRNPEAGETVLQEPLDSAFALHYCRAALYCYASPLRARQELVKAEQAAICDNQILHARLLIAASLTWLGKPRESTNQLRKLPKSEVTDTYAKLYLLQAEALADPSKRNAVVAYHDTLRAKGPVWEASECEDILSGKLLRMPRYAIDPAARKSRRAIRKIAAVQHAWLA